MSAPSRGATGGAMDTAMRDLEQIQERDPDEGTARRGAVFLLAGGVTLGLVYAMASVLGADVAEASPVADPLAALGASEGLALEAAATEDDDVSPERVERRELSFPRTLLGDDRPEVAATFAAAAAEHATLVGRAALVPTFANVPAAVAATPDQQALALAVRHDPLVASSLPAVERRERGEVGREGPYTLQVISYRTSEEAELFAEALRARGHDAFIQEADVENRGRFWRVRIGPFEARGVAERYRQRFETEEQMTTFVVRRRD
ncbi:MAG: SPOR domain-containing protein [Myxococcales bacterium]|nr:SPOR domain-containing protein [Myxococcales bacterium]